MGQANATELMDYLNYLEEWSRGDPDPAEAYDKLMKLLEMIFLAGVSSYLREHSNED